jgi:hypothetical protein
MTLVKGKLHNGFHPLAIAQGAAHVSVADRHHLWIQRSLCSPHALACSHLLNRITFRNCAPWAKNQVVTPWQLLTHSDQFVPENMQVRTGC